MNDKALFIVVTEAELSKNYVSTPPIRLDWLEEEVVATCTGGQFSINGLSFDNSIPVTNKESIIINVVSACRHNETVEAVVTVGDVSIIFAVTTKE